MSQGCAAQVLLKVRGKSRGTERVQLTTYHSYHSPLTVTTPAPTLPPTPSPTCLLEGVGKGGTQANDGFRSEGVLAARVGSARVLQRGTG